METSSFPFLSLSFLLTIQTTQMSSPSSTKKDDEKQAPAAKGIIIAYRVEMKQTSDPVPSVDEIQKLVRSACLNTVVSRGTELNAALPNGRGDFTAKVEHVWAPPGEAGRITHLTLVSCCPFNRWSAGTISPAAKLEARAATVMIGLFQLRQMAYDLKKIGGPEEIDEEIVLEILSRSDSKYVIGRLETVDHSLASIGQQIAEFRAKWFPRREIDYVPGTVAEPF